VRVSLADGFYHRFLSHAPNLPNAFCEVTKGGSVDGDHDDGNFESAFDLEVCEGGIGGEGIADLCTNFAAKT
jgi:hypothetical protein